ncbi:hypothetical protein [Variovorax sp. DXTD-1]|uniref:hypothetical protein n=1 Tax=Variovorax sp. DXTD-1 TaxID=2495592 RepID=UPI000F87E3E5|nr:hypothetical protein [Variovorax sp. DXTD-1]RST54139.1 hypothetical protein EJI00_03155 [Variovorax sp. DXTD-1]
MTEELNRGCLDERAAMRASLERILEEPKNTLSDGKALKAIVRIAKEALAYEADRASLSTSKQAGAEPVAARVRIWMQNGERHAELIDWEEGLFVLPPGEHGLYATPPAVMPAAPSDAELLALLRDARHRICNDAPQKVAGEWLAPLDNPVYGPLLRRLDAAANALSQTMQPQAGVVARSEHYDEVKATLQGAHRIMETVSSLERRVGPVGSHARGYTHKITNALRHLDALAAPGAAIAAGEQDGSEFLGHYAEAHELDVRTIPASREEAPATPQAGLSGTKDADGPESPLSKLEGEKRWLSDRIAHLVLECEAWKAKAQTVTTAGDWAIDHSAGRPILTYKNCSVIEAEDAEYVLRLIAADLAPATPPAAIPAAPSDAEIHAMAPNKGSIFAQGWFWGFKKALADRAALTQPTTVAMAVTEDMHVAAIKVLQRASGLDGLPQRMLDAMLAAAPAVAPAPASEAAGEAFDAFLCRAWGETELPSAELVPDWEGVRRFLIREWLGKEDDELLLTIRDDFAQHEENMGANGGAFSITFEIGGVSIERVCGFAALKTARTTALPGDKEAA